jgi:hypothetical protein
MRYYSISVTNPNGNKLVVPKAFAALNLGATYTSFANNQTYTAALDVEIDAFVTDFATPISDAGAYVRIWGISLQEIAQASNLNGFNISVSGGFKKGLPLANPAQSGVLFQGNIFQCIGNWVGTAMTLDFIVFPGDNPAASGPQNLSFNWPQGTPFSDAITQCLKTAGFTSATVNVSSSLANPQGDQHDVKPDMQSLCSYIQGLTKPIIGGKYGGVKIVQTGPTSVSVFDGTVTQSSPKIILFQEMIGQPTWIDPATIQVKCPMRADLKVGNQIKMDPAGVQPTTTPQSLSQTRDKSVFQGAFTIIQIRHVGHFRSPSPDAWVTVIDAVASS